MIGLIGYILGEFVYNFIELLSEVNCCSFIYHSFVFINTYTERLLHILCIVVLIVIL